LTKEKPTVEVGHIELANYFESRNQLEKAFAEYKALIQTVPYLDLFYQPAVKILLEMKDYRRALNILYELKSYQESKYVVESIGELHLTLGDTDRSIPFLEKAVNFSPWDKKNLFNLAYAYITTSQKENANPILTRLNKTYPGSNEVKKLQALIAGKGSTTEVADLINRARQLLKGRELDRAYELLQQSLNVRETATANELTGEILLVKRRTKEAIEYLAKARQMKKRDDPKLLYNLTSAYYLTAEYDKAWQTFLAFKKLEPNFADRGNLEAKIKKARENR
jgi:tetratricopeptide (TPR) repeat protein